MELNSLLQEKIKSTVKEIFGFTLEDVEIEHPENDKWGDYSTNVALKIVSKVKQSPMEIAKKISYKIEESSMTFELGGENIPIFESVDYANPGFINFKLSQLWLHNELINIYKRGTNYGSKNIGRGIKISLEHSNVNPNKAAHIGHLRNACLGQFIEKIYEYLGYDVTVQYYSNDIGLQVATSYMGVKNLESIKEQDYEKFDHYAWDVYSKMESIIQSDPEIKKQREELLKKIDDPKSVEFKDQIQLAMKILQDQLRTFQKLGIDYDVVIRESDIISSGIWESVFEKLKQNKNVYFANSGKSKGCWLIKMDPSNVKSSGQVFTSEEINESLYADSKSEGETVENPENTNLSENENSNIRDAQDSVEVDKIIVRANGVPTYTGKDIAYHLWKFGNTEIDFNYLSWETGTQNKKLYLSTTNETDQKVDSFSNAKIVFNVIDVKQTYAMEAVRKALQYLGYKDTHGNMRHINYGFVYLSKETAKKVGIDITDNRAQYSMSGRKGQGVIIDNFITLVDQELYKKFGEFKANIEVRNATIKYEMLKHNTFMNMTFDLSKALDIKGNTGSYIQYTAARCQSVLDKSEGLRDLAVYEYSVSQKVYFTNEELMVMKMLYRFPKVVMDSAENFAPNTLAMYLYVLSQKYNTMYNNVPILSSEGNVKDVRLLITKDVRQILKAGLALLGIESPDKI